MNTKTLQYPAKKSFLQRINLGNWLDAKGYDLYSTWTGATIRLGAVCILSIPVFIIFFIGVFTLTFYSSWSIMNFMMENSIRIFLIGFLIFQFWKIWKQIKKNPNKVKNILIANAVAPIVLAFICYTLFAILHFIRLPTHELPAYGYFEGCEFFTKHLEGGVRDFQGQQFKIQMCADTKQEGYGRSPPLRYTIRLAVFDQTDSLQALGYFTSGGEDFFYVKISDTAIKMEDWEEGSRPRTIKMPPSKWEWIRARLPFKEDLPDFLFN